MRNCSFRSTKKQAIVRARVIIVKGNKGIARVSSTCTENTSYDVLDEFGGEQT